VVFKKAERRSVSCRRQIFCRSKVRKGPPATGAVFWKYLVFPLGGVLCLIMHIKTEFPLFRFNSYFPPQPQSQSPTQIIISSFHSSPHGDKGFYRSSSVLLQLPIPSPPCPQHLHGALFSGPVTAFGAVDGFRAAVCSPWGPTRLCIAVSISNRKSEVVVCSTPTLLAKCITSSYLPHVCLCDSHQP